ncbi:adhesion protein FadA [Fusobacterium pseudoperiodonticum]|uniref:Adhesion protein FadA n=1 Tax=Fusobacterium pseudoperiodonticum TaxID=2663009 RepID=A0A2G9EH96_9FUSO|nr:adhesion protein FadA [Fusobacterium pseudoperiodonticum]ATV56467.1 adhesion protein FadA [Fusobacterium pseudoperiodonticum]ATV64031.1 adhesion protein FadA [Fusobacterium pseudoperiodonticum]PIM80306.1 adhesion protein FadA [Fusobacterium pseudoperiodonticum]
MKIKYLLASMLVLGSLSYSAEVTDTVAQEVITEVRNIEAEYQALMQKEAERKEEFMQEKVNLENEVKELKEKQLGREELYAKLKEDSKIRWHRDEYKKLLKRFDEYYNKLEKKIADKEQQIVELTKLLEVLN